MSEGAEPQGRIRRRWSTVLLWKAGEEGIGLVEVLIAVGILGLTLTVLLAGLSTGSLAVSRSEERVIAENLARSQLEYTKSLPYESPPAVYPTVTPSPEDYTVEVEAAAIPGADSEIEKITVTISREGRELLVVEDYKVSR